MKKTGPGTIIVAADSDARSADVLATAAALAARAAADLFVVRAIDLAAPEEEEEERDRATTFPERVERARELLAEQVERVTGPLAVEARKRVVIQNPADAILDAAREVSADVIVLGPHRGGDLGARVLGTTADRILRESEVPSLVVRGPLRLPLRRIGVPLDYADPSGGALDVALAWAERFGDGAELHLVHVALPVEQADAPGMQEERVGPVLERAAEEAAGRRGGAPAASIVTATTWHASASEGIVDYAFERELDLVVIATRGRGGVKRLLLGSVASGVARHAPCPVLLVPPERDRGG